MIWSTRFVNSHASDDGMKMKKNRGLGHFCAHAGKIEPGEPPEDGEISNMIMPSDTGFEIQTLEV